MLTNNNMLRSVEAIQNQEMTKIIKKKKKKLLLTTSANEHLFPKGVHIYGPPKYPNENYVLGTSIYIQNLLTLAPFSTFLRCSKILKKFKNF